MNDLLETTNYLFSESIRYDSSLKKWVLGKRYDIGYYSSLEAAQEAEADFERTLGKTYLDGIESLIDSTDKTTLSDWAVLRVNHALQGTTTL